MKTLNTKALRSPGFSLINDEATLHMNLRINVPGVGSMEFAHAGHLAVGLTPDLDEEHKISLTIGDAHRRLGFYTLMNGVEARQIGESLIRLADETYQSEVMAGAVEVEDEAR